MAALVPFCHKLSQFPVEIIRPRTMPEFIIAASPVNLALMSWERRRFQNPLLRHGRKNVLSTIAFHGLRARLDDRRRDSSSANGSDGAGTSRPINMRPFPI